MKHLSWGIPLLIVSCVALLGCEAVPDTRTPYKRCYDKATTSYNYTNYIYLDECMESYNKYHKEVTE